MFLGEIQTPHTRDCSAMDNPRSMRGISFVVLFFMATGWSRFNFYRRIIHYSANRIEKAQLYRLSPEG